jgi:hypothetical protein
VCGVPSQSATVDSESSLCLCICWPGRLITDSSFDSRPAGAVAPALPSLELESSLASPRRVGLRPLPWPPMVALTSLHMRSLRLQAKLQAAEAKLKKTASALNKAIATRRQVEAVAAESAAAAAKQKARLQAMLSRAERENAAASAALEAESAARKRAEDSAAAAMQLERRLRASLAVAERRVAAATASLESEVAARRRAEVEAAAAAAAAEEREGMLRVALLETARSAAASSAALEVEAISRQRVDALRDTLAGLKASLAATMLNDCATEVEVTGRGAEQCRIDIGWQKSDVKWARALQAERDVPSP